MRIAEVDRQVCEDLQLGMSRHLRTLIPGKRTTKLLGKMDNGACNGVTHGLGTMAGQGRAVLLSITLAVSRHGRKMEQHREPRCSLDQRADGRAVQADDQVSLPMAGNGTIIGFCGAPADHDLGRHERFAPALSPCRRDTQRPPVRRHAVSSRRKAPRLSM